MISGQMRLDLAPMDLGDIVDAAVETILPLTAGFDQYLAKCLEHRVARFTIVIDDQWPLAIASSPSRTDRRRRRRSDPVQRTFCVGLRLFPTESPRR
jgi:hypothetical protein